MDLISKDQKENNYILFIKAQLKLYIYIKKKLGLATSSQLVPLLKLLFIFYFIYNAKLSSPIFNKERMIHS